MTQLIFGIHAVQAILKTQPERLIDISIQQGRQDDRVRAISNDAHALDIPLNTRSKQDLDKLCSGEAHGANHQGVVAQCKDIKPLDEQFLLHMLESLKEPALLLILDGVTDPHNLGACLRTAEASGVHAVICPRDKSASLNPTVRKVACGAADIVPFVTVTNLARTLRQIQELGVWVIGAAGEATQSLYATDLTGAVALVLGAEGEGMRRLTREHCDIIANIPMAGEVSSLNVSVASGVCLFEAVRQRSARVAK